MKLFQLFKEGIGFFKHLVTNRYLIFELTKRDFTTRYVQNIFGLAWAILDPLAFMLILWVVFSVGFRRGENMGVPFVTYLISGLIVYLFFSETLVQASGSIRAYSFLVKKVNFRISVLPLVKILSGLYLHLIIVGVAAVIILFNGIMPSLYWLQFLYYLFALFWLLLGLSWLTASINLFFPDITNIIQIVTRFVLYLTPIFWNIDMFPDKYQIILKLNPLFYIVNGYRESLLFHRGFWHEPLLGLYFWGLTGTSLVLGITVFSKLKPHFADVV